jgi:hypothetical protein
MRLYYVDETQQLIKPSKLAYGTHIRAPLATPGVLSSAGPVEDIAVNSDTSNALSRGAARVALIVAACAIAGCSHLHGWWPWHHSAPAPEPAVNELVVTAAEGATTPALLQTWDRNTLRVDLTGLSGEGQLRLRPAEGHGWPIRLEFAVRPGAFARLEVRGEQRVTMPVPVGGNTVVMPVPQGLYAPATSELTLRYGP